MKSFNSETFSSPFLTLAIPRGAFAPKKGLVYIKNNHFVQFMEEISTIIKKFTRPWVPHFSMSGASLVRAIISIANFGI